MTPEIRAEKLRRWLKDYLALEVSTDKLIEVVYRQILQAYEDGRNAGEKCTQDSAHKAYSEGLAKAVRCPECDVVLQPIQRMGGPGWSHGDFQCAAEMQKEHEERLKEAVADDRARRCADDLYKGCYARGKAEGLEEAAKIAEKHEFDTDFGLYIADKIRARAKDLSTGGAK